MYRQFCPPDTMTRLGCARQMLPVQYVPALQYPMIPRRYFMAITRCSAPVAPEQIAPFRWPAS